MFQKRKRAKSKTKNMKKNKIRFIANYEMPNFNKIKLISL